MKTVVHNGGVCQKYANYDKDRRSAQRILSKIDEDLGLVKSNMNDQYRPSSPLSKKDRYYLFVRR